MVFRKTAALVLVLVLAVMSGCTAPKNANPTVDGPSPTSLRPSSTSPPTTSGWAPLPPTRGSAVNLTDCQGASLRFDVPQDWVRDDVPSNYELGSTVGPDAEVHLTVVSCGKLAVGGVDAGPAAYASLYVLIRDPTAGEHQEQDNWYLFGVQADNPALQSWMNFAGLPVSNASIDYSQQVVQDPFAKMFQAKISDDNGTVYQFDGNSDNARFDATYSNVFYFTSDPNLKYFENQTQLKTNPGPTKYEASADSRLAQVFDGQTTGARLASSFKEALHTMEWAAAKR